MLGYRLAKRGLLLKTLRYLFTILLYYTYRKKFYNNYALTLHRYSHRPLHRSLHSSLHGTFIISSLFYSCLFKCRVDIVFLRVTLLKKTMSTLVVSVRPTNVALTGDTQWRRSVSVRPTYRLFDFTFSTYSLNTLSICSAGEGEEPLDGIDLLISITSLW